MRCTRRSCWASRSSALQRCSCQVPSTARALTPTRPWPLFLARATNTQEPELLRADGDRLRRQIQELAVSQYGAFIAAAECTSAVTKEVASAAEHVQALQQVRTSARLPAAFCSLLVTHPALCVHAGAAGIVRLMHVLLPSCGAHRIFEGTQPAVAAAPWVRASSASGAAACPFGPVSDTHTHACSPQNAG